MDENTARNRSILLRAEGIDAIATSRPHPNGRPDRSEEWEVAVRDPTTHRYYHEYDSRVIGLIPPHLRGTP